ncbi:Uma2 family endonuclease [Streptomyces klenkii]
MHLDDFEELAYGAPETVWLTVWLEFIAGRLQVKPPADGNHSCILSWLTRRFLIERPDRGLYAYRGLKTEHAEAGRYLPDAALAPRRTFAGHGEWSPSDGVLMTVEIAAAAPGKDLRNLRAKRDGYAAAGIPIHVLIGRESETVAVYAEPVHGTYRCRATHSYGATVKLPDPIGITLDTEKLKDYAG